MFAKYAQQNHHDQYTKPDHQGNNEEEEERKVNNSFQPRSINLNQSVTLSDQDSGVNQYV